MKWKALALAAMIAAVMSSCGNNSADKETTATADTSSLTATDTTSKVIDSLAEKVVNVPEQTKIAFEKKYPKATAVKWEKHQPARQQQDGVEWDLTGWQEMDENDHTAWFHWQGNESRAYYDDKSNWVGTVDMIGDPASLPAAVTQSINKQFAGYTVTAVKRENDKNRTAFEVTLEKDGEKIKALVGENGSLIKKKKIK